MSPGIKSASVIMGPPGIAGPEQHVRMSAKSIDQPPASTEVLEISKVRTDGGTQGRVDLDQSVVDEYTELMSAGAKFPPVRVWFDGHHRWLVDGFQRIAAARQVGIRRFAAEVRRGTLEEAKWDSYAANWSHGIRRTAADIESAVRRALEHPKSLQLSNNQIARHLHLPEATFRRWKKRLSSRLRYLSRIR